MAYNFAVESSERDTYTDCTSRAIIGRIRRDGKVPVTFVFPLSGRTFRKLINKNELEEKTKGYVISYK
jgi:hypothetical protein